MRPSQTDKIPFPSERCKHVICTSLMQTKKYHLWSVPGHSISSPGTVETEPISSSFVDPRQDLAQCLDCSRAWINALTEYICELKENSRLFLSKIVWNWTGWETRSGCLGLGWFPGEFSSRMSVTHRKRGWNWLSSAMCGKIRQARKPKNQSEF